MPRKSQRSTWGSNTYYKKGVRRLRWWEWRGLDKVRKSKLFPGTKREGDAELARLRVIHEFPPTESPCPTFAQCWERWYLPELKERLDEGTIKPRTVEMYEGHWKRDVSKKWGSTVMKAVMPTEYDAWLNKLPRGSAHIVNVLVGNMVTCAKMRNVRGIEFKDVKYKVRKKRDGKKAAADRPADVYTLEQLIQLCGELRGTVMEAPAILMAFGSCRVGEACAPTVDDFKVVEIGGARLGVTRIDKQLEYRGFDLIPPKNDDSVRSVVTCGPFSTRLADIVEGNRSRGLRFINDNGCGQPVSRAMVAQRWREFFRDGKTSLPYLPMTRLRNSWETYMRWTLGVDKDKIDKMMGHTSPDVRSKHYDRPDEIMFAETVAEAFAKIQ